MRTARRGVASHHNGGVPQNGMAFYPLAASAAILDFKVFLKSFVCETAV